MAPRTIDYARRQAGQEEALRRVAAIEAGFSAPYSRERPRSAAEARLLRERGTPERLIGPSPDDPERRAFAVPPARGSFSGVELSFLDPADEDDRSFLVRAEHPELAAAIKRDDEVVFVNGEEINPRLHLTIHEIIASQLWHDDPPEVWTTARRLRDAGYERHEIFHMLGSALVTQIWHVLSEGKEVDHDRYRRDLALLPGSWEDRRTESRSGGSWHRKTAVKARKAARRARKRNRPR